MAGGAAYLESGRVLGEDVRVSHLDLRDYLRVPATTINMQYTRRTARTRRSTSRIGSADIRFGECDLKSHRLSRVSFPFLRCLWINRHPELMGQVRRRRQKSCIKKMAKHG
eukprot:338596-Hanusia_phi.AAC.1